MVGVKMTQTGVVIVDDAFEYTFDRGGHFLSKAPVNTQTLMYALPLPVVSIVTANKCCEVAVFRGSDIIRRFSYNGEGMDIMMKLQMSGGFIRILQNNGKVDEVRYNQIVFIYSEGIDAVSKVLLTGVTEV